MFLGKHTKACWIKWFFGCVLTKYSVGRMFSFFLVNVKRSSENCSNYCRICNDNSGNCIDCKFSKRSSGRSMILFRASIFFLSLSWLVFLLRPRYRNMSNNKFWERLLHVWIITVKSGNVHLSLIEMLRLYIASRRSLSDLVRTRCDVKFRLLRKVFDIDNPNVSQMEVMWERGYYIVEIVLARSSG